MVTRLYWLKRLSTTRVLKERVTVQQDGSALAKPVGLVEMLVNITIMEERKRFSSCRYRKAKQWLSAPFLAPELSGGPIPMVDLNRANLNCPSGLLDRLQRLEDPRKRRGIRHSLISTLAVATL